MTDCIGDGVGSDATYPPPGDGPGWGLGAGGAGSRERFFFSSRTPGHVDPFAYCKSVTIQFNSSHIFWKIDTVLAKGRCHGNKF